MARAHRIGQKVEVRVLRLITASPIEEKILATANEKLDQEAKIIEAGKFNQTSNASERRETLQRLLAQSADDAADEECIPTDEEINEMIARPNVELGLSRGKRLRSSIGSMSMRSRRGEKCKSAPQPKPANPKSAPPNRFGLELRRQALDYLPTQSCHHGWKSAAACGRSAPPPRTSSTALASESRHTRSPTFPERDFSRWVQSGMDMDEWLQHEAERKRKIEERYGGGGGAQADNGGGGSGSGAGASGGGGGADTSSTKKEKGSSSAAAGKHKAKTAATDEHAKPAKKSRTS